MYLQKNPGLHNEQHNPGAIRAFRIEKSYPQFALRCSDAIATSSAREYSTVKSVFASLVYAFRYALQKPMLRKAVLLVVVKNWLLYLLGSSRRS